MDSPDLYLASNSPRRRQIMSLAGWTFEVCPGDVDETPHPGEPPALYVGRLAVRKAQAASIDLCRQDVLSGVILAADTTVADESSPHAPRILGKPETAREASAMLRDLRARSHRVYTALAALSINTGQMELALSSTDVWMRAYTDAEIEDYVATGDPLDKAGAYAIQHSGFHPVERLDGCYGGVVGLPACLLEGLLRPLGVRIPAHQAAISSHCLGSDQRDCRVQQLLS